MEMYEIYFPGCWRLLILMNFLKVASGGSLTYLFWKSAYLSMCFSTRNRILVLMDWTKVKVFGRDVSRSDTSFYSPLD